MSIKVTRFPIVFLICMVPILLLGQYTAPTPPPESAQCDFLLGDWDVQGYFTAKNGQQVPFDANFITQSTHAGWALQADMRISFGGQQIFHGTSYLAYNKRLAKWVSKYFWSGANEWVDCEGTFSEEKLVLQCAPDPQGKLTRTTYYDISANKISFAADISEDDGQTWREKDTHYTLTRKLSE